MITPEDREKTNLAALVAIEPVIAGRRLARFSAGRLQLCRLVGLRIVAGGAAELTQAEVEQELLAFYFIHAFALDEVREACALPREEFFSKHIDPLSFEFPARELPAIMSFLDREFHGVEAANVEPLPKPGGGPAEAAPPNS
jgi:hypothetical protein